MSPNSIRSTSDCQQKKPKSAFSFSDRTAWPLGQNKLTQKLEQLKKKGVEIFDLSESNPTRSRFNFLNSEILAPLMDPKHLRYEPDPRGILPARQAVSDDYQGKGIRVPPDQIFLTASTSEAYSFLFRLLLNPGDHIAIPRPGYPLFDFLTGLHDIELDPYLLRYDASGWSVDLDCLRSILSHKTKAIILVHPNNPTGSLIKNSELEEIIRLARTHSIALISDEVFSDYIRTDGPDRMLSLASHREVLTFTLGGISKSLGLPQMKLAWIVANGPTNALETAMERLDVIADTYLSVSTPIQNSLPKWLERKSAIQNEIRTRIQDNEVFLSERLRNSSAAALLKTEGGWYATVQIPKVRSEEEWAIQFLEESHVFVHPGYFFDFDREAFIVMSLLPHPDVFQEGVLRILKQIERG